MKFHFQYLATRSGKSLLLFFDKKRYLFNIFEGFQRYAIESQIKLVNLDVIFLSSKQRLTALLGMYLTINESSKKSDLTVVCNKSVKKAYESAYFAQKELKLIFMEDYNDNLISVNCLYVKNTCHYIITLPVIKGKLSIDNLPDNFPKNRIQELKNEKQLVFNDQLIVANIEPDIIPEKIAIIFGKKNLDLIKIDSSVKIFFCTNKVAVQFFKSKFKDSIFYYLQDNCFVEYLDFYDQQVLYNENDFRYVLPAPNKAKECGVVLRSKDILEFNKGNFYDIKQAKQVSYKTIKSPKIIDENDLQVEKSSQLLSLTPKNNLTHLDLHSNLLKTPRKIVFLGTGCAIPSKFRNVSSTLIDFGTFCFLLDCGEDTLGQLHRFYGTYQILEKLNFVFISHSHADHHLGLVSLIKKRKKFTKNILQIIGPLDLPHFLINFTQSYHFIGSNLINLSFGINVQLCKVNHSFDSYGIRLEYCGVVICYSGDTSYCKEFVMLAKDCDFLIHEATFTDELVDQAKKSYHSTIKDVYRVAEECNAKRVLMTHFSQRLRGINQDESCDLMFVEF